MTSVYRHSLAVAYFSCYLAEKMHLKVRTREMIRGALLHDYFLYDWHEKSKDHRLHGFTHPARALKNAEQIFDLTPVEKDIIKTSYVSSDTGSSGLSGELSGLPG